MQQSNKGGSYDHTQHDGGDSDGGGLERVSGWILVRIVS